MEYERIYSTFFKRIFAFTIDLFPLAVISFPLLYSMKDFFIENNNIGVGVFWIIALIYFSYSNSKYTDGQSLGKKFMKLQVVDLNNNTLSILGSLKRYFLLTFPLYFSDFEFTKDTNNIAFGLASFLSNLILFTNVLFFIINKRTRETFNDYITKTIVVNYYRDPKVKLESQISTKGLKITGAVISILALISIIFYINNYQTYSELSQVSDKVGEIEEIRNYNLSETFIATGKPKNTKMYNLSLTIPMKYNLDSLSKIPPLSNAVRILVNDKIIGQNDSTIIVLNINQGVNFGLLKEQKNIKVNTTIGELKFSL